MGVPYLNIHYQLMQSDLSAPKNTICLFLSYIFLCSHTPVSAILVVSGAYYSCNSYSAISSGGIPFQAWFSEFNSPAFIMALPSNVMHSHLLHRCVCFLFPKAPKQKYIFGGTFQILVLLKKKKEKILCKFERFGVKLQSCKPFHGQDCRQRMAGIPSFLPLGQEPVLFWLGLTVMLFECVPYGDPKSISSFFAKQTGAHLFNVSVMTWRQWDSTVQNSYAPW